MHRLTRKIRHVVFGSFIAAHRARNGRGRPRSRAEWNADYRRGRWDYLEGLPERSRQMIVLGYLLGRAPRPRVLDVGCGTGGFLATAPLFPIARYHGIDASDVAVERARERFASALSFPATFEVADFEDFECDDLYDVIVFNESISYADDPVAVLARFERGLTFDGVFVVSLCYNWWDEPMMRRITRARHVLHSTDVINEEGLTWHVRVLAGHQSGSFRSGRKASMSEKLASLRTSLAEMRVVLGENIGSIIMAGPAMIAGRARSVPEQVNEKPDDESCFRCSPGNESRDSISAKRRR